MAAFPGQKPIRHNHRECIVSKGRRVLADNGILPMKAIRRIKTVEQLYFDLSKILEKRESELSDIQLRAVKQFQELSCVDNGEVV
jgi:hypothetical protein